MPYLKVPPEFKAWTGMKSRCDNPNETGYKNYGGRGITYCQEWKTFREFLKDMGPKPSPKHSLDRIDVNGNYEPKNCRWATKSQQDNNRRDSRKITINGTTKTITEWARVYGFKRGVLRNRIIVYRWDPIRAITQPIDPKRSRKKGRPGTCPDASIKAAKIPSP